MSFKTESLRNKNPCLQSQCAKLQRSVTLKTIKDESLILKLNFFNSDFQGTCDIFAGLEGRQVLFGVMSSSSISWGYTLCTICYHLYSLKTSKIPTEECFNFF